MSLSSFCEPKPHEMTNLLRLQKPGFFRAQKSVFTPLKDPFKLSSLEKANMLHTVNDIPPKIHVGHSTLQAVSPRNAVHPMHRRFPPSIRRPSASASPNLWHSSAQSDLQGRGVTGLVGRPIAVKKDIDKESDQRPGFHIRFSQMYPEAPMTRVAPFYPTWSTTG